MSPAPDPSLARGYLPYALCLVALRGLHTALFTLALGICIIIRSDLFNEMYDYAECMKMPGPGQVKRTTGASHDSHLGNCCPSAYSSGEPYIKKRQVWNSWSGTDWPHLEIMPDFSTEKSHSTLILTSTCWQEISLSNTIELTTVVPQQQKICCFKHCFLPVFENSRDSIVCLCAANPVTCHGPWLGGFVFMYVCWLSNWNGHVRKNKTTQSWHVTGFAAHRQTMESLEFSKTGKKRCLKQQIFCFCGMTVVSSMVFEREISCQHVAVKMRVLRFFSVEKSGVISRWGQSVSDRDFHTCLFFTYDTPLL